MQSFYMNGPKYQYEGYEHLNSRLSELIATRKYKHVSAESARTLSGLASSSPLRAGASDWRIAGRDGRADLLPLGHRCDRIQPDGVLHCVLVRRSA